MTHAPPSKRTSKRRSRLIKRDGRVHAFDRENQLISTFPTRIEATCALNLAKQADAILKGERFDTTTGAKQHRQYRRNKRAKSKRLALILDLAATGGTFIDTQSDERPDATDRAGASAILTKAKGHDATSLATVAKGICLRHEKYPTS